MLRQCVFPEICKTGTKEMFFLDKVGNCSGTFNESFMKPELK